MIVKELKITFPPSSSPDVVSYSIFLAQEPAAVDFLSQSVDLGALTPNAAGDLEVDLSTIPPLANADAVWNIGVVAVDDVGNMSAMSTAQVTADFQPPSAPGTITIVTG